MLHKTKGIVLRTVRYGETSVVASIYTELFGIQSFMVNGVRSSSKGASGKANLLQPAAILDMVMYHNEKGNLQRLKEFRWSALYTDLYFNVIKNSIALFMIELLHKTLKEPEVNPELFAFAENSLLALDTASPTIMANMPLYFALQLTDQYGFRISDNWSETRSILDFREGEFISHFPEHSYFLQGTAAEVSARLLSVTSVQELEDIKLNQEMRRTLLQSYQLFYALHLPDFGTMKTLPVLQQILS